ncbi:DUF5412 domain-containing protein [Neobacillus novalis]|uniref:DUF5412 domain-containing protein n=1 Tax=Neobacillus novalis TaxID=220687 RepID=A0AA95MPS6_9BACI|nr:DUF5412 domain-containing protein [Neobacillus novalis]WHY87350.1 DUF5412 domain-containing protein [Neobacillus novalis]
MERDVDVKREKRKFYKKFFLLFGLICLLFIGTISYGVYWAFYDMERLPKGEFLTEETSSDGQYTLKAYLTNGGATVSYAIRGELVFNEQSNKTKNIYWNYREQYATINWIDNDTVVINGHKLNVPNEKFDWRNQ